MFWLLLRLAILVTLVTFSHFRTYQSQLILVGLYTSFELLWVWQRSRPAYSATAEVLFSGLLGVTAGAWLTGGPQVSLALFWPSLMLRLENAPAGQRRALLMGLLCLLGLSYPENHHAPQAFFLVPALFSLLQVRPGAVSRSANSASLAWSLGLVIEAALLGGTRHQLSESLRGSLLLLYPQIGLRYLNRSRKEA